MVDEKNNTIDFLLTEKREKNQSRDFWLKQWAELTEKPKTDKNHTNLSAIRFNNAEQLTEIEIRQVKYLNNIVEPDHLSIRKIVKRCLVSSHSTQ